jgi:hypothetical protein
LTNHDYDGKALLNVLPTALDEKCRNVDGICDLESNGAIKIREPDPRDAPASAGADYPVEQKEQLSADTLTPEILSYSHPTQDEETVLSRQTNRSDDLGASPRCEDLVGGLNELRVAGGTQEGDGGQALGASNWTLR